LLEPAQKAVAALGHAARASDRARPSGFQLARHRATVVGRRVAVVTQLRSRHAAVAAHHARYARLTRHGAGEIGLELTVRRAAVVAVDVAVVTRLIEQEQRVAADGRLLAACAGRRAGVALLHHEAVAGAAVAGLGAAVVALLVVVQRAVTAERGRRRFDQHQVVCRGLARHHGRGAVGPFPFRRRLAFLSRDDADVVLAVAARGTGGSCRKRACRK
jgi:hypothetical protein